MKTSFTGKISNYNKNNNKNNKIANYVKFVPEIFAFVKCWESPKRASLRVLVFAVNHEFVKFAKQYFPRKMVIL